jgi:twitching motility protein PilT
MVLLDDFLFNLWKAGKVTAEDALTKSNSPEDFQRRIANAQRGVFDDEEDVARRAKEQGTREEAGAKAK